MGAAQKLHPSLDAGAVGAILAFADCAPTACYEIYAAWKEGDAALAREKQERIAKAAERIVGGLSIPGVKYAMDYNGCFGGVRVCRCCRSLPTRRLRLSSCWRTSGTEGLEGSPVGGQCSSARFSGENQGPVSLLFLIHRTLLARYAEFVTQTGYVSRAVVFPFSPLRDRSGHASRLFCSAAGARYELQFALGMNKIFPDALPRSAPPVLASNWHRNKVRRTFFRCLLFCLRKARRCPPAANENRLAECLRRQTIFEN